MITPILQFNNPAKLNLQNNNQCTISFQGKDLLKLTQLGITRKVRSAIRNNANIIGEGGEGVVYKIPQSSYCIKITGSDLFYFGNWNMNISQHEKVNHVVAIANNGTRMMKLLEGFPLSYNNKPEEIYSLPAKSYVEILKQITTAYKYGRTFDYVPQNIIYNPQRKTLIAIDFSDITSSINKKLKPISQLYEAMQDNKCTLAALKRNRKLIKNLLNIVLNRLQTGKESEFPISIDDVKCLLEFIPRQLQPGSSPKQYKDFKNCVMEILKLKKDNTDKGKLMHEKIASVQKLMDQVLCVD